MQRVVDLVIAGIALLLAALLLAGPSMLTQQDPPPAAIGDDAASPRGAAPQSTILEDDDASRDGLQRRYDRGPRPFEPGRGHRGPVELTAELIGLCLEVAGDIDAELAGQLRKLQAGDPEAFERKLRDMHRLIDLAVLKQRDPNQYALKQLELAVNAKVNRLSRQYGQARRLGDADEMRHIEQRLRDQVRLQVGFSLRAREDYVCRLEELAQGLQQELEDDRSRFDERVEARLEELTRPSPSALSADAAAGSEEERPDMPKPFLKPVGAVGIEGAGDGRTWSGRMERPGRPGARELEPELIEACMEVARDIDPALAAELDSLRSQHPEQLGGKLHRSRRLMALARLKLRDPVLYSLKKQELDVDAEVSRLAGAARTAMADGGEVAADLQNRLRQYLRLQIAFSLHSRQNYVASLEDLIGRLRAELEREQSGFEDAVSRRMARLLDRATSETAAPASEVAEGR